MTTAFFTENDLENAVYDDMIEAMTRAVAVNGFVCIGKDDAARILRDHAIAEAARAAKPVLRKATFWLRANRVVTGYAAIKRLLDAVEAQP